MGLPNNLNQFSKNRNAESKHTHTLLWVRSSIHSPHTHKHSMFFSIIISRNRSSSRDIVERNLFIFFKLFCRVIFIVGLFVHPIFFCSLFISLLFLVYIFSVVYLINMIRFSKTSAILGRQFERINTENSTEKVFIENIAVKWTLFIGEKITIIR